VNCYDYETNILETTRRTPGPSDPHCLCNFFRGDLRLYQHLPMKPPLWTVTGNDGKTTLRLRAWDCNEAVSIASRRKVRVESVFLVDEDQEASTALAIATLKSLRKHL